jgi:hypothetical protein
LTKLGTYLGESGTLLIFKVKGQGHWVKFLPHNIRVNTRINILQWILITLGTYLVLKRIWNHINFQCQRSRSPGQIFRRWDMPRFALPLLLMFKNVLIPRQNRENGVPDGEIFVNLTCTNRTPVYS